MLEVQLADPQKRENLTIYPLIFPDWRHELDYQLLRDALEDGFLKVTEVGEGTVPQLMVENLGDVDVLIIDGEQLIGAKQNRMANRSIILAAKTKTQIPVSCMEQGRWHFTSREFKHGDHYSPSKVRRHARKHEARHARAGRAASHEMLAKAQRDVWGEINCYSAELGVDSASGALDDLHESRARDIDAWSKAFSWVDDQVGILAFLGDEPLGMDIIGCHKLYGRFHKRLVTGYIMDALAQRRRRRDASASEEAAKSFLEGVRQARLTEAPTVGAGVYYVLSGDVMGGELRVRSGLVHLSAFPLDEGSRRARPSTDEPPIAPPSQRRRRWIPDPDSDA